MDIFQEEDERDFPMKMFLESNRVEYHVLYYVPMNIFFQEFENFCKQRDYIPYRKKYGKVWKQYDIKYTTKNLLWGATYLKTKYLMGVSLTNRSAQIESK